MPKLNTFPVSIKVADRRIVIVGGGVEALNKARLAVKTTALVVVIAERIAADFSGLTIKLVERAFVAADLDGAALVFVADDGADGQAAIEAARAQGVPLNVVDRPELCDFYTPAIVDRAPVTVAISSEGDAPVLARLIRAKIEALLSPQTGAVARLAGELRDRVGKLLPDGAARRRYYEALVTSGEVGRALEQGAPEGRREALRLLDAHAGREAADATVWLIGAGPGAEDLLTLRAQRLLQEADVIVHDRYVPELVAQMGRRDAERVLLDDGAANESHINDLLLKLSKQNQKVAWLMSGDPGEHGLNEQVIGRLRRQGVEVGIVPGVTGAELLKNLGRKVA